jgi:succinyl-diaminopimelate desuccinylase
VACDSSLGRGTGEINAYLKGICEELGLAEWYPFARELEPLNSNRVGLPLHEKSLRLIRPPKTTRVAQSNIYLTVPDFSKLGIVDLKRLDPVFLLSHLDTAAPKFADLESPFDLQVEGTLLKGLGVATGKGDFLAKIWALQQVNNEKPSIRKWQRPPILVGTHSGSQSMRGALEFAKLFKDGGHLVVVGAPTQLKMAQRTKGLMKLEAKIPFEEDERKWREEHSMARQTVAESRLFRGETKKTAIAEALEFISHLPGNVGLLQLESGDPASFEAGECFLELDLVDSLKFSMIRKLHRLFQVLQKIESYLMTQVDTEFEPPYPTLTLTRVLCTETHLTLQCVMESIHPLHRSASKESDYALKAFDEICQVLATVSGSVDLLRNFQPTRPLADEKLKEDMRGVLRSVGLTDKIGTHSQCIESSVLDNFGFRCLSFGPGKSYNPYLSLSEVESIETRDFLKAVEFYKEIIRRFCA